MAGFPLLETALPATRSPAQQAAARTNGACSQGPVTEAGKARFNTICIACHGIDAKGNQAMGSPNLTDDIWLFGGTAEDIEFGLRNGRSARMQAHADILGNEKAHLVATYVYSLSHPELAAR